MRVKFSRTLAIGALCSACVCGWLSAGIEAPPPPPSGPGSAPPAPTPAAPPAAAPGPSAAPSPPTLNPPAAGDELREIVIVLHDGRVFSGRLLEQTADRYVLEIAGIRTVFEAEKVERANLRPTVSERYAQWRATLADTDAEGLVMLSEWLERSGRADLALLEMEALTARLPENVAVRRRAQVLRSVVEMQAAGRQNAAPSGGAGAGRPGRPEEDAGGTGAGPAGPDGVPLLTREQTNLIKVMELDLARPPRVIVPRETMERAMARFAQNPEVPASREARDALLRRPGLEQLDLLFRLRAREFYPEVDVQGLPESLRLFRDGPHREYVINSCATSGCHGGENGGRLRLSRTRANSEITALTNFYILSQFQVSPPDGKGPVPLLDWRDPERSPLIELGLPRAESRFPHPPVVRSVSGLDVWRPTLLSREDRRATDIAAWMNSMIKPRPEYSLNYQPLRPFVPGTQAPAPAASPR